MATSSVVSSLLVAGNLIMCCVHQAEVQTVTGALAALDDDLDMIQQQLEHQMQAQDQNQDDARSATISRCQSACSCMYAIQRVITAPAV